MFDPCDHKIRNIAIKVAREIRKIKGLPEEKNLTILIGEVATMFGISVQILSSTADHIPNMHDATRADGSRLIPMLDCPSCGKKESMVLRDICQSCKDADGGKYKTVWECKCGFRERSEKFRSQWYEEFGVDFKSGSKKSMGIEIVTDDGLK